MKEIRLSGRKYNNRIVLVDDEDYEWLSTYKWYLVAGKYAGLANGKNTMHRMILGITETHIKVDHVDMNGLNNQRNNIRPCTQSQNGIHRPGKYRYKGMERRKYPTKIRYRASIRVYGKDVELGHYDNEEDGARAYDLAAIKYYGEFAYTNFPLTDYQQNTYIDWSKL